MEEKTIDFIEMLAELKKDNLKRFRVAGTTVYYFVKYGQVALGVDAEPGLYSCEQIRDILRDEREFVEIKQQRPYLETIKNGERYFFINKNLSVKETEYDNLSDECSTDAVRGNIFRTLEDAVSVARRFASILDEYHEKEIKYV